MILTVSAEAAVEATLAGSWADTGAVRRDETEATVVEWLGRLRLLHGIPFEYLVPDDGLLLPETIRFFHLDRNWTDAAVDGAIAAGIVTGRDRREIQTDHAELRDKIDDAERSQWVDPPSKGSAAAPVTGFLLRSRAVSGWPGLHVRATRKVGQKVQELRVLRLERLAPAVLLALFDNVPDRVDIEEPRTGIQFGVRSNRFAGEAANSWWLDVRDPSTGEELKPIQSVRVPFRAGSAGVLHMTELKKRLVRDHVVTLGRSIDSAEMALQFLRYPYRQSFEGVGQDAAGPSGIVGRVAEAAVVTAPWLISDTGEIIERIEGLQ